MIEKNESPTSEPDQWQIIVAVGQKGESGWFGVFLARAKEKALSLPIYDHFHHAELTSWIDQIWTIGKSGESNYDFINTHYGVKVTKNNTHRIVFPYVTKKVLVQSKQNREKMK